MLTPPVRANARYNGCIGLVCFIIAGVIMAGGWAMSPQAQDGREAFAYGGSVLLFALGFAIAGLILLTHAVRTERDCDEIDANTRECDRHGVQHYTTQDDPRDHTGGIHYDGDYSKSYPVSVDGEHFMMDSLGNLTKEE